MTKNKKLLLSLGTLATTISPIAAVVSCGSSTPTNPDVAIEDFVSGSTPTAYAPSDNNQQYPFLISDRVFGEKNHGIGTSGLWSGITNAKYQYGTLVDSISYELGYLQNGKLLMAAYYKVHPEKTGDIRSSLSRIGVQLQLSLDNLKNSADFTTFTNNLKSAKKTEIINAVKAISLDNIIESSAKDLATYDYLGFKTLAPIFSDKKFADAKTGDDFDNDKKETIAIINNWLSNFTYDLKEEFDNHSVAENTQLAYAYDEVIGYSWDFQEAALGDRKNASQTLIKKYLDIPTPLDHNTRISDWRINDGDANHRNLQVATSSAKGQNSYSNQIFRFAATNFTENNAQLYQAQNDTLARGIDVVDEGDARYNSDGSIVAGGTATTRHLEFGLFKSVTLTDSAGASTTFDSDENLSTNAKSINGDAFNAALSKGVKSFSFEIKDNKFWVKKDGTPTTHKVTAEDFWYSIQKQNYYAPGVRNSVAGLGGTQLDPTSASAGSRNSNAKIIEDYLTNKIPTNKSVWNPPSKTDASVKPFYSGRFTGTYGMEPITDDKTTHDLVVKDKKFTIQAAKAEGKYSALFWHDFIASPGDYNLIAVPSENIKSQVAEYTSKKFPGLSTVTDTPVVKYGVYYNYIASSLDDFEFAGKYIPNQNGEKSIVYKKNAHYANEAWTQNDKTPLTWTQTYIAQEGTWGKTIKDGYLRDDYYIAPISVKEMSDWKNEIAQSDPAQQKAIGLTYVKSSTSQGDVGGRGYSSAIPFDTSSPKDSKFWFNDGFAKVFYGDTMENLYAANSIEPLIEHLYHGKGLEFKSAIQAAANGFGILHDFHPGTQESNAKFGPEALIPGSDASTNPVTVYESEIFNRASFGKNFVEVTKEDYRSGATAGGDANFVIGGEKFLKLQENVKDALDAAGIKEGEQVVSEILLNYMGGLTGIEYATYLQHIKDAFNSLDPRINFVANAKAKSL